MNSSLPVLFDPFIFSIHIGCASETHSHSPLRCMMIMRKIILSIVHFVYLVLLVFFSRTPSHPLLNVVLPSAFLLLCPAVFILASQGGVVPTSVRERLVVLEVVFLLCVAVEALLQQDLQRAAIACVAIVSAIFIPLVSVRSRWKNQKSPRTEFTPSTTKKQRGATPGLDARQETRKLTPDARLKASFHNNEGNHPSPSSQNNRSSKLQPPPPPKIIIDDARIAEVCGKLVFEHHREQHASHHLHIGNKGTLQSTQIQESATPSSSAFALYHNDPYKVKTEDIRQEYDVNFNYDHPITPSSSAEIIEGGVDSD